MWHVEELARKMKSGLFRHGQIALATENGGRKVLLNGQHICNAIVNSKKTVSCVVEEYLVDNALDMSELFRQFEILPRGLTDMVRVEAAALGIPWPKWITSKVVSAIAIDMGREFGVSFTPASVPTISAKKTGPLNITKEKRIIGLRRYIKEGDFVCNILVGAARKDVKHLCRVGIIYMMFKTSRLDNWVAQNFWSQVRDGDGLHRGDATKTLREFLLSTSMGSKYNRILTNHEYIYRTSIAWNAHKAHRSTKLSYRVNSLPPKLK